MNVGAWGEERYRLSWNWSKWVVGHELPIVSAGNRNTKLDPLLEQYILNIWILMA